MNNRNFDATDGRTVIKQEAMTPLQGGNLAHEPGSVNLLSVRNAPQSVIMVSDHMGKKDKIGK